MNEQAFFHWDLIRPPLQSPAFSMGASLLDFSILELRKEKSRDAARSRRGKENYEFYELAKLLPLPAAITSQLDKASIIRLSISYLKLQEFASHGDPPWDRDGEHGKSIKNMARRRTVVGTALDSFEAHHGTHILQSLDGFAFALGNDGRFLYVSETVSIYLGLSQVEMTGSSVFDYVHSQDHQELAEILGLGFPSTNDGRATPNSSDDSSPPPPSRLSSSPPPEKVSIMLHDAKKGQERTFCLRMKSTLTKRGVHVRTSGYRVVCVIGHMRPQLAFTVTSGKENLDILGFVGLAIALPPPTVTELRIERDTFIMRLSPEFKIIYCDTLISQLMEWTSEEMSSYSFYDYCHPGDLKHLQSSHYDLISKGQVLTNYFRLLNKGGGYVWVQMCATTLFSSKTSEEHTTLAIIYVLSGIERRTCAMIQSEKPGIKNVLQTKTPCQKKEEDKEKKIEMSEESHSDSANADDHIVQIADNSDGNASASHATSTVGEVTSTVSTNIQEEMVASKAQPGPKFSRRKMEKPRKRKKECEDSDMENMIFSSKNEKTTNTLDQNSIEFHLDSLCQKQDNSHDLTGSHSSPKSTFSASPEDLSVTNNFPKNGNFINSSMTIATNENRVQNQSPSNHVSLWKTSVDKANLQNNNLSPSSVKDLENMVKHLPRNGESYFKQVSENEMNNLRLPAVNGQVSKNRTSHWRAGNSNDMTDPHPASNLLRTLYANRESVIRSSISRPQCFNPAPCDMVDSIDMLTPPANEDAIKEPLTLSIPQINLQGRDKVLTPNVYNNNNNNNLHVSVINKGIADSYNITPPSSVSPEDKQLSFMDSSYELNSSNNHHHHCHNESSLRSPSFSKSMTFPQTASSGIHNDFAACSNKFTNGMTSSYQPIPSYQHHIYNGGMNPVVVYDKRSEMWYPLSYSS